MHVVVDHFDLYWHGFAKTLGICLWAGTGALVLGTLLAAFRVSPVPPLRWTGTAYVTLVRNCPLTVVLFFVAFGLPEVGVRQSYYRFAVGGLIVYTAAFVCEAVRSGINAVPNGQAEAARAIGLDFRQTLGSIVLPQAFRTVVPPLGNVWIALAKNTSIAAGFAVTDLAAALQRLANQNADQLLTVFLAIVAAYLVITLPSAWLIGVIERRTAILR